MTIFFFTPFGKLLSGFIDFKIVIGLKKKQNPEAI